MVYLVAQKLVSGMLQHWQKDWPGQVFAGFVQKDFGFVIVGLVDRTARPETVAEPVGRMATADLLAVRKATDPTVLPARKVTDLIVLLVQRETLQTLLPE